MNVISKKSFSSNLLKKKRVLKIPPRPAASQEFYDLFLKEKRPKGYSKAHWSRSRLAITTLRYLGLRSSEAGLVKVQELESLIEGSDTCLNIYQPKVNSYRVVLVPKELRRILITEHKEDLSLLKTVHNGNLEITLSASCQGKTKGLPLSVRDWSTGLNQVLYKTAHQNGFKGITTRTRFPNKLYNPLPGPRRRAAVVGLARRRYAWVSPSSVFEKSIARFSQEKVNGR